MVPPKVSISDYVVTFKGRTSIRILNKHNDLKKKPCWGNHFWGKGYCVDIVGLDDDEKDFVFSLVELLESYDYSVEKAFTFESVVDIIDVLNARVALLGLRPGNESGLNLISRLKEKSHVVLVVIMTAYAAADTAIEALQKGAYDYLLKPINPRDLLATLERCFEKIFLEKDISSAEQALLKRNRELEKTNTRLKESEERYRRLIETMNDGCGVVDETGIITCVKEN